MSVDCTATEACLTAHRPHLEQRVATAVVYLNDACEFEGGQLQFQDGDLRNVAAAQGSMVSIAIPSMLLPMPVRIFKVDHFAKVG